MPRIYFQNLSNCPFQKVSRGLQLIKLHFLIKSLQSRKLILAKKLKYDQFAKINTREKSKFLPFTKINTRKIQFFLTGENKYTRKLVLLK